MPARVWWLIACLVVSLVSIGGIALTVYPTWTKTYGEAVLWGLYGSALFLVAMLVAGIAVATNREAPMPSGWKLFLVLLLVGGVGWALLVTISVGL
jgi:hypothetical protein